MIKFLRKIFACVLLIGLFISFNGATKFSPSINKVERISAPPFYILNKSHPLAQGLVGFWLLDEGGGQIATELTGCLPPYATLTNGAVFQQSILGNYVSFDGTNDYINAGTRADIGCKPNLSISVWMKPTDFANYRGILGKTHTNQPSPFDSRLDITTGKIRLIARGNGASTFTEAISNTAPTTGVWSHIVMTYDNGNNLMNFYINGKLDRSVTPTNTGSPGAGVDNGDNIYIGSRSDLGTVFKGGLKNMMLYSRTLLPTEVMQLYSNPYCMFF